MKKYQLAYTLKTPGKQGYHYEFFETKAEFNAWLKKNRSRLYWHQIAETNPKSRRALPIINFDPSEENYTKKTGTLMTHYETGMECLGLVFYEDGVHGAPNPDFDPNKPENRNNFRYFSSYEGLFFIETGFIIQFPDGKKIGMAKDREFAKRDGFKLSFYPHGYVKSEWVSLFAKENLKVTVWIPKKEKLAENLKP